MNPHRLTLRIALVSLAALGLFLGALLAALALLRDRIDASAEVEATRYVETRLAQMQTAFEEQTLDYTNWDDAWSAATTLDLGWLYDNLVISTDDGSVFDAMVLFDGPVGRPLAWREGGGRLPRLELLPPGDIALIRAMLAARADMDQPRVAGLLEFAGQPALVAAAPLRPATPRMLAQAPPESWPTFLVLRFLDHEALAGIEAALTLSDLRHVAVPDAGQTAIGLHDIDGRPIGHLAWQTRRPGTEVIAALRPLLVAVGACLIVLTLLAALLARSNALRLIAAEVQARDLAQRDPLTGLPNRLAMNSRLAAMDAGPPAPRAVLYIDLNGFKRVNDMLGHAAGDGIVAEFGRRLGALIGPDEFVARVGGDEFVVLPAATPTHADRAASLSRAIAADVAGSFQPDRRRIHISAAIGMAEDPSGGLPMLELVRRADLAMLEAKRDRRGGMRTYSPEIEAIAERDAQTEQALRDAIETGEEFAVLYQPIVAAEDGRLVRAEALARWTSARLGPVGPDVFIALAEASGLIPALGRHLLTRIAADLAACPGLCVSVNVSPLQLRDSGFVADLTQCAQVHGIDPARVEVEITERVLIDDPDAAALRLDALIESGFSTAIDDFGTGFSSIRALRRLPFRTLKIDRSFVMDDAALAENAGMIDGIVRLGHAMGQTIVCEGVESAAQAAVLRRLGCDLMQGYHFGRPMPLADLRAAWPALDAVAASPRALS